MKNFSSKQEVFNYLTDEFGITSDVVLIRGSTAKGSVNSFSDFDVEIYGEKKYPIYEIHLFQDEPILLTIYFYGFEKGEKIDVPDNVKVLRGEYTLGVENVFNSEIRDENPYDGDEVMIRNCQLTMDFFFKFMRTKSSKDLMQVQKKLDFKYLK